MARLKEFADQISQYQRVLLDYDTIVTFFDGDEDLGPLAETIFRRMTQGLLTGYVAHLTVMDLVLKPLRSGEPTSLPAATDLLLKFPGLLIVPADVAITVQTAALREKQGLNSDDALLLATALVTESEAIVAVDTRWKKLVEPVGDRLACVCLSDYISTQ